MVILNIFNSIVCVVRQLHSQGALLDILTSGTHSEPALKKKEKKKKSLVAATPAVFRPSVPLKLL